MYKLLKAGLFRLKKEIIFWLFLFLGFVIAIFVLLKAHLSGNEMLLDKLSNEFTLYIGFFIAIIILAVLDIFSPLFSYVILKLFNFDKSKKQIKNNPFYMPLKAFFRVTGIYVAILFVRPTFELSDNFMLMANKIYKVIVTITIANSLANSMTKKSRFIKAIRDKSEKEINDASTKMMIRLIRVGIYIVATFLVFYEIGYDLSGLITGLGLGTVVLTLAAQDTVKSLLGGFIIFADKPFKVGDYIKVQNYQGTVEDMTLRSTRIRQLDDSILQIPNSAIASSSIENLSKMRRRRYVLNLHIVEDTKPEKIVELKQRIYEDLMKNENIIKDTISIYFTEIAESSFRISIYFYFDVTDYNEFLELKDGVNRNIVTILNKEKVSLAYDTKTIEIKK